MSGSTAILRDGKFYIEPSETSQSVDLEGAYSETFFKSVNSHSYKPFSDYANEIFLNHYLKIAEVSSVISGCDRAKIAGSSKLERKATFHAACRKLGISMPAVMSIEVYFSAAIVAVLGCGLSVLLTPFVFLYFFMRYRGGGEISSVESVFIVRSGASLSKMSVTIACKGRAGLVVYDPVSFSPEQKSISIYSWFSWSGIPRDVIHVWSIILRDVVSLTRDVISMLGWGGIFVWREQALRVIHKGIFEVAFYRLLQMYPQAKLYSGDKDDRFAILETRISRQLGRDLTCIPHGLEYGYRLPSGLCGSRFYTFTAEARDVLNLLYEDEKYVYDHDVALGMLLPRQGGNEANSDISCCYFTEPYDPEINIKIISELSSVMDDFVVKLHPLEDKSYYLSYFPDLLIIDDFEAAISASLCLARKSTVLLEAVARDKMAAAILINEKDKMYVEWIFPSLGSAKIRKVFEVSDLVAP